MAKRASKGKKGQASHMRKPQISGTTVRSASGKSAKIKPAKVFVYALALAALGGGGYLVYDRLKRRKETASNLPANDGSDTIINNSLPSSVTRITTSSSTNNFPLKRGSRGERVKVLQTALAKTTPSIAIDGQFGPQTAAALTNAGYPEVVDETLFNKITGNSLTLVFDPTSLAKSLYTSAQAKDVTGVLYVLKQLKSVSDYTSVNEYYKKQSFISKTIVTDLLDYSFKDDELAKTEIRNQFLRIGLKVDPSGTWSLQGIRLFNDLITIRETVVTDLKGNKIPVRKATILGDEVQVSNGMTWFKSIDNSILSVPTQDVKYT